MKILSTFPGWRTFEGYWRREDFQSLFLTGVLVVILCVSILSLVCLLLLSPLGMESNDPVPPVNTLAGLASFRGFWPAGGDIG